MKQMRLPMVAPVRPKMVSTEERETRKQKRFTGIILLSSGAVISNQVVLLSGCTVVKQVKSYQKVMEIFS